MAEPRPRVVYLTHSVSSDRGGMEKMGRAIVAALTDEFDITVVSGDPTRSLPADVRGCRVWLPSRPAVARIHLYRLMAPIRSWWCRRRADVVWSNGAVARVACDVTTVHLCHAAAQSLAVTVSRAAKWARRGALAVERAQYSRGDSGVLVAVSPVIAEEIGEHYARSAVTIPNGVEIEVLATDRAEPTGPLRSIIVTHDFVAKGVTIALDALVDYPGSRLSVVGGGDCNQVRADAAARGVEDRVNCVGPLALEEIPYDQHDCVLSLSGYESFGLTMIEGAAHGCVVVATNTGIASEFFSADAGILVERNAASLRAAWRELENLHRWSELSRRGRQVASTFTSDRMIAGYRELFRKSVAR